MNDIKMLHNDEALCIDCMQSFHDHADFDNLNVHVTKAICMQMRKSNRMQNYKKNYLWKLFDSVSCHRDDKNWDKTLSCLICWEWLVKKT